MLRNISGLIGESSINGSMGEESFEGLRQGNEGRELKETAGDQWRESLQLRSNVQV